MSQDEVVFGPFMKLNNPAIVEIFGNSGFDFVIIDTEHGPTSMETAENLVRAAELVGATPIVRVSSNDSDKISRALDIGAQGIQIPQISNKADAEKAVKSAKFFPLGERGVCRFVRAASYSAKERYKYFSESNYETLIILQIEGLEGVKNIDEILKVDGIDILFLGPYDLSQSLGIPGQVDDPAVEKEMLKVVRKAREQGKVVGTFVDNVYEAVKWKKAGIKYISYSVDVGILYEAGREIIKNLDEGC